MQNHTAVSGAKMNEGIPTWENTVEPKREMSFHWAVALASNLGYTYLKFDGNIYAVVDANAALLTPYTLE